MNAEVLTAVLMLHGSPGQTAFSVEPAPHCAPTASSCEGARWSDFFKTWVRQESRETAEVRYRRAAAALIGEAQQLLCVAADGSKLEGCTPYPGAVTRGGKPIWSVTTLAGMGAGVAMVESGFREDVMNGRGWAKKASQDGGRGRGPGWEACAAQIHPAVAWRYADSDPATRARAALGDRKAREEIARSLLGTDEAALGRCFRTQLRMLIRARKHCAWAAPDTHYDFATISMYGTGTSCTSNNDGKTILRQEMFRTIVHEVRQGGRKP